MLKCKTFILTPSELTCTRRHIFFSHPTQTYSSTWTFYFHCHSPHGRTRPHRRFLSSAPTYTCQPVHTDAFFSLTQLTQAYSSAQTFSSPKRAHFCLQGHLKANHLPNPHRAYSCPQEHLEAAHLSCQLRAHSCPQGHLEATRLPIPHRALSCPQGHLEATRFPSPHRAHYCPQGHLEAARFSSPLRVHSCPQGHLEATHFSNHPNTPLRCTKGCYCPTGPMEIALLHNSFTFSFNQQS